ncbi:MAG: glycosyltransferase [Woeseiaceae bacterium]|nr:glycosyltransferase [Woeseiaceae bacterium]
MLRLVFFLVHRAPGLETRALKLLMKAERYDTGGRAQRYLLKRRDRLPFVESVHHPTEMAENAVLTRSIVLKNPRLDGDRVERGVLLIKFTETFADAFIIMNCRELENYFHIVLEPSWSGYALPEIHQWMALDNPVIIQCSETLDFQYIEALRSNLYPVRFGSSDWVDDRVFHPLDVSIPKVYDSIFIANFHAMKRHHVYLKTISRLKDIDYRSALVCGQWGNHRKDIESMVRYFDLNDVVDQFVQLSQESLNELLNQSRLNVLMSLKEGSNRTIFEGFFANVPGLVLRENIGVNKDYINESTGYLISEDELERTLRQDKECREKPFEPRSWACSNIAAARTTAKLEDVLAGIARDSGEPWTRGLVVKVNSPEATYYDQDNVTRLWSTRELLDAFGENATSAEKIDELFSRYQDL